LHVDIQAVDAQSYMVWIPVMP